ncbi:Fur family transcriptional regulator [Streptomyces sp. NPDC002851]
MPDLMNSRVSGRNTRQRAAVVRALDSCGGFVSAQALHLKMAATDAPVGLSTIYRTLRALERSGHVDVVRDETGERLYRKRATRGHSHYLICRVCSKSHTVDAEVVEQWAERVSEQSGFAAVEHTVELTGVCRHCHTAGS